MPYVRTVKTASGATAVQVVWSSRRGSREIEHLGSAHDEAELELLKAAARQRVAAGQLELGLALVSWSSIRVAVPADRADDLVGGLGPLERPGRVVPELDPFLQRDGEFFGERKTPRSGQRRWISANQRSTWLTHEE